MGRKESNQTKNQTVYFAEACENALFAFWQTPYYVWSVKSLNSRWNQILYCLKILSTNCLQIYNLLLLVPLLFEHTLCHYEQNSTWWLLEYYKLLMLIIFQGIRWHEISCDRQRFGSSLIRAFVLVANTTTGPDSKLHLTLHLSCIFRIGA